MKKLTDGWMDDGRKVITIAQPEQSSGDLKTPPPSGAMPVVSEKLFQLYEWIDL